MTDGTGNVVEGEWRTLSPSFSSMNTAPRNHRHTERATPTVPNGSYEKFKSNTRPVSKQLVLLYSGESDGEEVAFLPCNVISNASNRQAQYLVLNKHLSQHLGASEYQPRLLEAAAS
jgi:hypothetical protein